MKRGSQRDICTAMFIVALFTIVNTWKQLKCLSTDKWIKKMWCKMEYCLGKEKREENSAICDNMNRPCGNYVKWKMSSTVRSHLCVKSKQILRKMNQICGCWGRGLKKLNVEAQKLKNSTYQKNKCWRYNVQHDDYI